jgi:catechol 2,3-dioxygenase-like lactoylglutathione lyase family enzyme
MKVLWVSGVAPIVGNMAASKALYGEALGVPFAANDEYPMTDELAGVKHFGLWTLEGAAESCFGTPAWPDDVPVPQASIEFEVEDAAAVEAAAVELEAAGYQLLAGAKTEPWGQTVARLLAPEGLLVGVAFTPWQH